MWINLALEHELLFIVSEKSKLNILCTVYTLQTVNLCRFLHFKIFHDFQIMTKPGPAAWEVISTATSMLTSSASLIDGNYIMVTLLKIALQWRISLYLHMYHWMASCHWCQVLCNRVIGVRGGGAGGNFSKLQFSGQNHLNFGQAPDKIFGQETSAPPPTPPPPNKTGPVRRPMNRVQNSRCTKLWGRT